MGPQATPLDSAERDLAAAQLDYLAPATEGRGRDAWKAAVLEWHCAAIAKARDEAWIPGMASSKDPKVEELLARYYGTQIGVMLRRLKAENLKLRRENLKLRRDLIERVPFQQRGGIDAEEHEGSIVEGIQSSVT